MSTGVTLRIRSTSSGQTERLGEQIGAQLIGGETIELVSDLGGGKTTFVHGLAKGWGSEDRVASPTFTICKVYRAHGAEMYHFDFYRLPEAGIIADELAEVIDDPRSVVVVEWAESVRHVLPDRRLTVRIESEPDGARTFTFQAAAGLEYLMKGVGQA